MAATKDLTHEEAHVAFEAFAASVGPKAEWSARLNSFRRVTDANFLGASIWPKGIGTGSTCLSVEAANYNDLLAALEAAWAEHSDLYAANTIREMALAIISITADLGECTDAALRAKFDGADVTRYGDRACEAATEMASNGPFSIVKLSGANDIAA